MISYTDIAQKICHDGMACDKDMAMALAAAPEDRAFRLMAGADLIRRHYFQSGVHLCAINNAKSGKCSEDCRFCAQSHAYGTGIDTYPLKAEDDLCRALDGMAATPVHRYSLVTSGRRLSGSGVDRIARAVSKAAHHPQEYCASLGILDKEDFETLKSAGITRYHHNLETSRSHFDRICTTHTYDQRIETIKCARTAGLSICSGGIFGIGETMAQVVELALDLKALDVDALPLNFLSPVQGTPLAGQEPLSPLACLKIIALFRYMLPDKEIIVCGGRLNNLKELHPLVFFAGASGLMTGNYLTTAGNQMEMDTAMISRLGLTLRETVPGL
ncbi:MAG: biotin synthase BioB [Desulfobacter sp.]|nr:MAG: biotin synthase BioB [Desulfobacter sp.]